MSRRCEADEVGAMQGMDHLPGGLPGPSERYAYVEKGRLLQAQAVRQTAATCARMVAAGLVWVVRTAVDRPQRRISARPVA